MSKGTGTILIIPDIHEPSSRKGSLAFCKDLRRKYKPDRIIFIGDVVDLHSISFHTHHPNMPGPNDEFKLALIQVKKWYRAFPKATVILGNHDRRIVRKAEDADIPARCIRPSADLWETPGWNWVNEYTQDGVHFVHGDGCGASMYPAYNMVRKLGMSVVMGHHHSAAGVKYLVNPLRRMFGMDVGALCDDKSLAFRYMGKSVMRSVLGAAVIKDGDPQFIPMHCGRGERYHDSKF